MNRPSMMAVVTVMVSCATPTVTKPAKLNEKDPEMPAVDQMDGSPEIAELEELKNHIDVLYIPAFQSLYFKLAVEVKFSTSKKMVTIRKRLKKARTYLSTKMVVLMYLQKYQKHLQDLKKFELATVVNSLEPTLYRRQFIWKQLEDKQNVVVTEISEAIEIGLKAAEYLRYKIRRNNRREKPLLRFKGNGDFSDMTQYDLYYLNHLREFLDYGLTQLHKKRTETRRKRIN